MAILTHKQVQLSVLLLISSLAVVVLSFNINEQEETTITNDVSFALAPHYLSVHPPAAAPKPHHHHHHPHPHPPPPPPVKPPTPPAKPPTSPHPPPPHHHHHYPKHPPTPPPAKPPVKPPSPPTKPPPSSSPPAKPTPPPHHHHHPKHPPTPPPPPAKPPVVKPPSPPAKPPVVKPPSPPVKPPVVKPPSPPVKPPVVKPPSPPVKPPVVKPPSPPVKPPVVKPPRVKPPSPPTTPPAPYRPVPPRRLVAVQGVVYCKSCKYVGVDTFLGATPLVGATVRLACNNTKYHMAFDGKTDKNGYFLIQPQKLTTAGSHKCKVFLLTSPLATCRVTTDIHGGRTGAILMPTPPSKKTPVKKYPFELFTVGPFAFEPYKKCK